MGRHRVDYRHKFVSRIWRRWTVKLGWTPEDGWRMKEDERARQIVN